MAASRAALSLNSARCTPTTVSVRQNQLMNTFDGYRVPGLSTKPWHDMVRTLGRPPVMNAIVRANNFSNPLGRNLVHSWATGLGREPVWMDAVRAINKPVWADHFAGSSTSALVHSFHRNLLPSYTRFDVGAKLALQSMDLGMKLTPALPPMDFLRPSTAIITSIMKDFDSGWVPPHSLIPGLTGGALPGFDAAVRSILEQTSAEFEIDIEVPDEEIEFTAWPDVELQPDLDFAIHIDLLSRELQSAFLPRRTLQQGLRNIVILLLVASLAQTHAPDLVSTVPPDIEKAAEENWPDWAHLPPWLVDIVRLGMELAALKGVSSWIDGSRPDK